MGHGWVTMSQRLIWMGLRIYAVMSILVYLNVLGERVLRYFHSQRPVSTKWYYTSGSETINFVAQRSATVLPSTPVSTLQYIIWHWMFPPLDILLQYWIEHVCFGLSMSCLHSLHGYSTGGPGFANDCPCGVWCRGLTTCPCLLVHFLEI